MTGTPSPFAPARNRDTERFTLVLFLPLILPVGLWLVVSGGLPETTIIAGGLGVVALVIFALLWVAGRDFDVLFVVFLAVGYFQGFLAKLFSDTVSQTTWGTLKYALLLAMVAGCLGRVLIGQRFRTNRAMRQWLIVWLMVWGMLALLMVEARRASPLYLPLGTVQSFGVGNMVVAILVFFRLRRRRLDAGLRLFVWAGVVASVFGVVQRFLGPARLEAMGILKGDFLFLASERSDLGYLDSEHGLRAFSFFDSHHAFSAFLILTTVALQVLRRRGLISRGRYLAAMGTMWAGFAVTFNLTNIVTGALTLALFALLERTWSGGIFRRAIMSRPLWTRGGLVLVLAMLVVAVVPSVRSRFLSVGDVRVGAASAGSSLRGRIVVFESGVDAVVDYPLGLGLYLNQLSQSVPELVGRYARVDRYFESRGLFFTGDNWFQWLMVQIGLPGFFLYSLLFLIPIYWGLKRRNRLTDVGLRTVVNGMLALMIGTFLGGVSNSPILAYPPNNALIWGAAALLMKAPLWDAGRRALHMPQA